ncbi:MAG: tripartite tricarboxylate transporter substrate binding protein [Pseudomonadota bacterium]
MKLFQHVRTLLVAAAMFPLPLLATAQSYPTRPVRIVVPYPPGQGTDVSARYFAEKLSKALGQTVYVENKAGAGGNIGADLVAKAPPDGYTLIMGTNATHAQNAFLFSSVPFDAAKDFEPIILTGVVPMVIAANPSFSASTVQELIAMAKSQPGKIDVALPSTSARIVLELLRERAQTPLFGVPYKGSAAATTDVLGGQLPLTIDTVTAMLPQITAGKLKVIAITSLKGSDLMPGVKSVAEQGVPSFEMIGWNALYAPRGTPAAIIRTLNAEMVKILAQPDTRERMLQIGFEPAGGSSDQLREFANKERAKWGPLIKAAGIKVD